MSDNNHNHQDRDEDSSGEQTMSGDTPGLESDDNVLDAAHEMGLYDKADEEHPSELGVAEELEKNEKSGR